MEVENHFGSEDTDMGWVGIICGVWLVWCVGVQPGWADDLATARKFEAAEPHMGTQFTLTFYADSAEIANRAQIATFQRIAELDGMLSDYVASSELSQLSAASPQTDWQALSADLGYLLARSRAWSELSGGAFDVTIGPLSRLWRRARKLHELPSPERLAEARQAVGYRELHVRWRRSDAPASEWHEIVDVQTAKQLLANQPVPWDTQGGQPLTYQAKLTRPQMRLDLGGIAKGYTLEAALNVLARHEIRAATVLGGGQVAASAPPPGEAGWKIGVAPLTAGQTPDRFVLIQNTSVATSGDAWQFVELAGKRYSHIFDPRSGDALTQRSTVTIIARSATDADALSTAVSVLGPTHGEQLIRASQPAWMRAIFVNEADDHPNQPNELDPPGPKPQIVETGELAEVNALAVP